MDIATLATVISLLLAVLVTTPWLGAYVHAAMEGQATIGGRFLRPLEVAIYRFARINPRRSQGWREYATCVIVFTFASVLVVYALQRLQAGLPLDPSHAGPIAPELAVNTAVSFATTTNWQNYAGESAMSHLTQMAGLAVQNVVAAAAGLGAFVALARGLTRRGRGIGNFWVDLVRGTIYVLLPLAMVSAVVQVALGVPQTLAGPHVVTTLESASQTIALGPIASQDVVKILGSNGGGFLNANGAHPLLNPSGPSNWVAMFLNLLLPLALTFTFGRYARDQRQGWTIFGVMVLLIVVVSVALPSIEAGGNGLFPVNVDQAAGNMEGKEVRFGASIGGVSAAQMAGTTTGAPPATYGSLLPLSGGIATGLILLGEVTPGGVGSGLMGMLVYVLITVFIGGLMVGRSPNYLGKRVEAFEMKMVMLAILLPTATILGFVALSVATIEGRAGPASPAPHGFTEILYAFASMTGNNGSAFASLTGNTPYYNIAGAFAMLLGRFGTLIPMLALAGAMAPKRSVATTAGSLPTHGGLFMAMLVGVVLVVGAMSYAPAIVLGPLAEQLALQAGRSLP